jgi:hypothetical protein
VQARTVPPCQKTTLQSLPGCGQPYLRCQPPLCLLVLYRRNGQEWLLPATLPLRPQPCLTIFPYDPGYYGAENDAAESATEQEPTGPREQARSETRPTPLPKAQVIELPEPEHETAAKALPPTIFVLANRERLLLTAGTLSVRIDWTDRTIPLGRVDLDATEAANRQRRIDLRTAPIKTRSQSASESETGLRFIRAGTADNLISIEVNREFMTPSKRGKGETWLSQDLTRANSAT